MVPVPPQLLVQRLQQKRCVLFAGAGLSAAANFPSWPQLLSELIDEVRAEKSVTEELRKLLDRNQLLDVADACQRMIGAKGFRRFMVRRFGGHHAVPEVHQKITELPLAGIVTTNYDKLFELAYRGELKVRTHADPQLTELPYDGPPIGPRPFLLKAHGDVDRPENLVLTAEDYARQIHSNPQIKVAFNWIMFSHAILFVGYSLKDPDFTAWLQWYSRIFRPHSGRYALMSDVGPVEAEQIRSAIGVEVLPYPKDRHELVAEFIDALVKLGQPLAANLGEKATESDARESVDKKAAKEFIARLDSIPYQRAALLARPTPYEQSALFKKYGSGWVEMRKASLTEIALSKRHRGKVIVIPDVFESSLATYGSQKGKEIWLNPFRIATGGLTNLRMRPDGSSEQEVRAVGILKRWYADLLISLSADKWDVRAFWYDWRQDFNKTAAELNSRIEEWFGDEPVCHIIAHRAGGMVARTFIKSYPDRWNAMLDRQSELPALRGGRLVMLGASQRGSLLIPQLITGGSLFVRKLSMVDLFHSETAIQAMLNSWPSLYQQLPSP
ncbi:MAG TPA: SIR2 family protein, partial [Verrucomicrobiae bacterium]|nr:SIR2 family protein [Verrucomicrobiae bacterium]